MVCIGNLKCIDGCTILLDNNIVYNESYMFREDGSFIVVGTVSQKHCTDLRIVGDMQ